VGNRTVCLWLGIKKNAYSIGVIPKKHALICPIRNKLRYGKDFYVVYSTDICFQVIKELIPTSKKKCNQAKISYFTKEDSESLVKPNAY